MSKIRIVFAGSFLQHSAQILSALCEAPNLEVVAVVTTPPDPQGKTGQFVKNPVQQLAEQSTIPVFTPAELRDAVLSEIEKKVGKPDLLLTAGYGKLLPSSWLSWPTVAALNLHFSLLPKFRGANPAEWALLLNETSTGVTLIEMSPEFDTGKMIASAALPITDTDTRESLYEKVYQLGAEVLPKMVSAYLHFLDGRPAGATADKISLYLPPIDQPPSPTPYATRLRRDDGFIAWSGMQKVMAGEVADAQDFSKNVQKVLEISQVAPDAVFVERTSRALAGFPSLWTVIPTGKGEKRMKILGALVMTGSPPKLQLTQVHIEGKSPAKWAEVKNSVV